MTLIYLILILKILYLYWNLFVVDTKNYICIKHWNNKKCEPLFLIVKLRMKLRHPNFSAINRNLKDYNQRQPIYSGNRFEYKLSNKGLLSIHRCR